MMTVLVNICTQTVSVTGGVAIAKAVYKKNHRFCFMPTWYPALSNFYNEALFS